MDVADWVKSHWLVLTPEGCKLSSSSLTRPLRERQAAAVLSKSNRKGKPKIMSTKREAMGTIFGVFGMTFTSSVAASLK